MGAPDESVGRRVKCPKCGEVQRVPESSVATTKAATQGKSQTASKSASQSTSKEASPDAAKAAAELARREAKRKAHAVAQAKAEQEARAKEKSLARRRAEQAAQLEAQREQDGQEEQEPEIQLLDTEPDAKSNAQLNAKSNAKSQAKPQANLKSEPEDKRQRSSQAQPKPVKVRPHRTEAKATPLDMASDEPAPRSESSKRAPSAKRSGSEASEGQHRQKSAAKSKTESEAKTKSKSNRARSNDSGSVDALLNAMGDTGEAVSPSSEEGAKPSRTSDIKEADRSADSEPRSSDDERSPTDAISRVESGFEAGPDLTNDAFEDELLEPAAARSHHDAEVTAEADLDFRDVVAEERQSAELDELVQETPESSELAPGAAAELSDQPSDAIATPSDAVSPASDSATSEEPSADDAPAVYAHTQRRSESTPMEPDREAHPEIEAHIEKTFGPIESVIEDVNPDIVGIDIQYIPPHEGHDYHTLVTLGMSDLPMSPPNDAVDFRYAELMLCLPSSWPVSPDAFSQERHFWPIRMLQFLARLPHLYETWLGWAHTVPNGDPPEPYADDARFTGAILLMPSTFGDDAAKFRTHSRKRIHFYSVVPLYPEEMAFKVKHSAEELFEKLQKAGVDEVVNVKRRNVSKKLLGIF